MTSSTPLSSRRASPSSAIRSARRLAGELTEEQFRPHRLMNGLYLQLHAYMLRIAVPYGTLNSRQMRKLAEIARNYDRGYGHFTTRQNLQFNWPTLKDMPDILAELASVEMHAIQTSGNCIRNVTADHFAGVAADEIADPRPYAEILRQWSSLHPEFSFLPRKFKIAVNGAPHDRAVIQAHDIGLQIVRDDGGRDRLHRLCRRRPRPHADASATRSATSCREAISSPMSRRSCASTISRAGATTSTRRASRSCVHEKGEADMRAAVEAEFAARDPQGARACPTSDIARIAAYFAPPPLEPKKAVSDRVERRRPRTRSSPRFVAVQRDAAQGARLRRSSPFR